MRTPLSSLLVWLTLHGFALPADQAPKPDLPRVVLVGDSIRLGYAATVEKELAGRAMVVSPKTNGGDSSNVLKNLDEWVIRQRPNVVHFNCGIHDTKKSKTTGQFQVSPEQYEANLRKIVERIRQETKATVLFATSTPILDERAAKTRSKVDYELLDASIEQYNRIACKLLEELRVPVNDLHAVLPDAETRARLMTADGVHFVPEGSQVLGKAVAVMIAKHLPSGAGRPTDPSAQIPSAGVPVSTTVTLPHPPVGGAAQASGATDRGPKGRVAGLLPRDDCGETGRRPRVLGLCVLFRPGALQGTQGADRADLGQRQRHPL